MEDALFSSKQAPVIAIGWKEIGDISKIDSIDHMKERYATSFPTASKGSASVCSGMLFRFVHDMEIGDYVIYPSKPDRMINIGIIDGPYYYDSAETNYPHKRNVKWIKKFPRARFSQGALYEVGSALTLFLIKNYAEEFMASISSQAQSILEEPEEDESISVTAETIIENTKDFILKELSKHLKGYEMEEFIANLLQAMGYRTKISPQGGDSGIDIIAYKDELPPRILVQVKSQDSDIKETTIQSLKGAMSEGDYGLFVTMSNFTKNAKNYLNKQPIIKGINGLDLVDLILKFYDLLDEKYQKIIPLKKVYIPIDVK